MHQNKQRRMALIGITADINHDGKNGRASLGSTFFLPERYCRALEQAGGIPVILSPTRSRSVAVRALDHLDGLLISGGNFDIHPSLYGENPIKGLGQIKAERTRFELNVARVALKRDLPLLGICGGAQAINVALGGTLYQDIAAQLTKPIEHQQSKKKHIGGHQIRILSGTRLAKILRRSFLEVNTTHHQAVKQLGAGLVINATAEDGLIEGIESSHHSFVLGVQWHPEALAPKSLHQRKIFSAFVEACRAFRQRA
jgi:putative glutamine amidotransferase